MRLVTPVFLTVLLFFSWPATASQAVQRQKLCSEMDEKERRKTERCKTDQERREDEQKRHLAEIAEKEKPTKSSFMKWVHLDGYWIQSASSNMFQGLAGMHVVVFEEGRLQLYGPPGIILVRQQVSKEEHQLHFGITWGFSFRLFDIRVPGTDNEVRVFGNLAKVWLQGVNQDIPGASISAIDMVGLSVTFAK
ncbi:MAG: hypothetical protein AAB627_01655 [Patescibacteria group bacterium]